MSTHFPVFQSFSFFGIILYRPNQSPAAQELSMSRTQRKWVVLVMFIDVSMITSAAIDWIFIQAKAFSSRLTCFAIPAVSLSPIARHST